MTSGSRLSSRGGLWDPLPVPGIALAAERKTSGLLLVTLTYVADSCSAFSV